MAIDPAGPTERALPFYRLSDNTLMLLGKRSTLNVGNRGFYANAGFIVTEPDVSIHQ